MEREENDVNYEYQLITGKIYLPNNNNKFIESIITKRDEDLYKNNKFPECKFS